VAAQRHFTRRRR